MVHRLRLQSIHPNLHIARYICLPSTLTYTGEYNQDSNEELIKMTHGYSKDHRPDLKQAVLATTIAKKELKELKDEEVIEAYKQQSNSVEKGFRF